MTYCFQDPDERAFVANEEASKADRSSSTKLREERKVMTTTENTVDAAIFLSAEQKNQIRKRLTAVRDDLAAIHRKVSLPASTLRDIHLAVNSGDESLLALATETAYWALYVYSEKKAHTYVETGKSTLEDYMQTLYIAIATNIKSYDGKHALVTFFEPSIVAAFMITRNEGHSIQVSKYYLDQVVIVSRAEKALQATGLTSPNVHDIYDYIQQHEKCNISELTIRRVRDIIRPVDSLDGMTKTLVDNNEFANPEAKVIAAEKAEEVHKVIDCLPEKHRTVMNMMLDYIRENEKMITTAEACERLQKLDPTATKESVARVINSAKLEFSRYFSDPAKDELPVNGIGLGDGLSFFDDEQDILDALAMDEDFFNNYSLMDDDDDLSDSRYYAG